MSISEATQPYIQKTGPLDQTAVHFFSMLGAENGSKCELDKTVIECFDKKSNQEGSSSSKVKAERSFSREFLSPFAEELEENSSQMQWLCSCPPLSPLVFFLQKLDILDQDRTLANKPRSTWFFRSSVMDRYLEFLRDLLKEKFPDYFQYLKESLSEEFPGCSDVRFFFDDLFELDRSLEGFAFKRFCQELDSLLQEDPENSLGKALKEDLNKSRGDLGSKIASVKAILSKHPDHLLFHTLFHLFSPDLDFESEGKDWLSKKYGRKEEILDKMKFIDCLEVEDAFQRKTNQIIYGQFQEKIKDPKFDESLRDLDKELKSKCAEERTVSLTNALEKVADFLEKGENIKGRQALNLVLQGKITGRAISDFCDTLFQRVLLFKGDLLKECTPYTKFCIFYLLFDSLTSSVLEQETSIYHRRIKLSFLDLNITAFYNVFQILVYEKYCRRIQAMNPSNLKDLLLKKNKEMNDLNLPLESKIDEIKDYLRKDLSYLYQKSSELRSICEELDLNVELRNPKPLKSYLNSVQETCDGGGDLDLETKMYLQSHPDAFEFLEEWHSLQKFIEEETESPLYAFLESRKFFDRLNLQHVKNSIEEFKMYQVLFQGCIEKRIGEDIRCTGGFSELNEKARELILEEVWKQLKGLEKTSLREPSKSLKEQIERLKTLIPGKSMVDVFSGKMLFKKDIPFFLYSQTNRPPEDSMIESFFKTVGLQEPEDILNDEKHFFLLRNIERLKKHFLSKIENNLELLALYANLHDFHFDELDSFFIRVIEETMCSSNPSDFSLRQAIEQVCKEIAFELENKWQWLVCHCNEYGLTEEFKGRLERAQTYSEKNSLCEEGFFLLEKKLEEKFREKEIQNQKSSPLYILFFKECCFNQDTNQIDRITKKLFS